MQIVKCEEQPELVPRLEDLIRDNGGLFFHSTHWVSFLSGFLGAEDLSCMVVENRQPYAFMPLLAKDGPWGKVANSSPFYGSNGGIIVDQRLAPAAQLELKAALLRHVAEMTAGLAVACVVTNPLYEDQDFYRAHFPFCFEDHRIGQLTPLPNGEGDLFGLYHSKVRNMVRKAQKAGFAVVQSPKREGLEFLMRTHHENLEAIGGLPKEERFFTEAFAQLQDHLQLWIAELEGEPVAALLLFVYGGVVEYFTPVVKAEFRELQPLSLLIYEAMKSAVKDHRKWWNWGGTWRTQEGVYRFKKRWGTEDRNYYYFINVTHPETFLHRSKQELLEHYKYFYTVPFEALAENQNPTPAATA